MSEEIDKHLASAMGQDEPAPDTTNLLNDQVPAPVTSTSKRTLKGPVAERVVIAPPPQPSFAELKMQAKIEVLQEMLAEQKVAEGKVKADKRVAVEAAEPEEMVQFKVNLPPQAADISVDGREYYHGFTYKLPLRQAIAMQDIQAQAWRHDEQVQGTRKHAAGYRTSGIHINGQGQEMTHPHQGIF
jgi:hypothetical protein